MSDSLNFDLVVPSVILSLVISGTISSQKNIINPLTFFSILFFGYAFSGLYFSYGNNISNAIYYEMTEYGFNAKDMIFSLYTVLFSYLSCVFGFYLFLFTNKRNKVGFRFINLNPMNKYEYTILLALFFIGFFYWLYISFTVADGPFDLLSKIGVFHALLIDDITTIPYLLSYGSVYLIFLYHLQYRKKISKYVYIIIFLTFLMKVSTGRLSGSVLFLISFPLIYLIKNNSQVKLKYIFGLGLALFFLLLLYVGRYYSNVTYIGFEVNENPFSLLGKLLFGRTNIGDLQSITFSYEYISNNGLMYGLSFLDFTRFWLDRLTPFDFPMSSIGIRLKHEFFGDISGAPAPGIISEMILNFGIFGLYFGMLIVGYLIGKAGYFIQKIKTGYAIFIYTMFLLFVFILPKVDSTSIQGFIWNLIPFGIILFFLNFIKPIFLKYKVSNA